MSKQLREKKDQVSRSENREKLVLYLANPENKFLNRKRLAIEVLGFAHSESLYQVFTPAELTVIEGEALDLRRKCYASKMALVDDGLIKKAASGDAAAAKLAFQRYEGWSEKTRQEVAFDGPMIQQMLAIFPPEMAEKIKLAMIAKHRELAHDV